MRQTTDLRNRLAALRLLAVVGLALPLAGCFQPVYGPGLGGGDMRATMQAIQVQPIYGNVGHYLTQELRFLLNGSGTANATPSYRLRIWFSQTSQTPLIDTVTGRATANSLYARADYELMPVDATSTTKPIARGFVVSQADYDRVTNRFANVRSGRDAEIRNAKSLAEQIRTRLTAELAGKI